MTSGRSSITPAAPAGPPNSYSGWGLPPALRAGFADEVAGVEPPARDGDCDRAGLSPASRGEARHTD
ncbi:hypothetical protein EMIHUDRAFT_260364 [Emiliania huxleyi CCMP1516]|uniref:Uncharacterized protein n=2 Tax=Emiliania huxleyi TaxID=2903 RepID=A0A0D3KVV2_EMIH1|nr:hypothetical protein EMIHUDRAFT_260364 [Emiliania huxleyi CCMP1516]EOD39887.1 hypothetical protein EMIHUDRAFT_260364 [Emiliania huxleyi CCMP1516]|eukprot:XP_005792316.1 hypothetical protein EMIHUDRAFT_260364 [Emiliania huxleyi CCMP1516]